MFRYEFKIENEDKDEWERNVKSKIEKTLSDPSYLKLAAEYPELKEYGWLLNNAYIKMQFEGHIQVLYEKMANMAIYQATYNIQNGAITPIKEQLDEHSKKLLKITKTSTKCSVIENLFHASKKQINALEQQINALGEKIEKVKEDKFEFDFEGAFNDQSKIDVLVGNLEEQLERSKKTNYITARDFDKMKLDYEAELANLKHHHNTFREKISINYADTFQKYQKEANSKINSIIDGHEEHIHSSLEEILSKCVKEAKKEISNKTNQHKQQTNKEIELLRSQIEELKKSISEFDNTKTLRIIEKKMSKFNETIEMITSQLYILESKKSENPISDKKFKEANEKIDSLTKDNLAQKKMIESLTEKVNEQAKTITNISNQIATKTAQEDEHLEAKMSMRIAAHLEDQRLFDRLMEKLCVIPWYPHYNGLQQMNLAATQQPTTSVNFTVNSGK